MTRFKSSYQLFSRIDGAMRPAPLQLRTVVRAVIRNALGICGRLSQRHSEVSQLFLNNCTRLGIAGTCAPSLQKLFLFEFSNHQLQMGLLLDQSLP